MKTVKTKEVEFKKEKRKLSGVIWNNDTPLLKNMAEKLGIPLIHAIALPAYSLEAAIKTDYSGSLEVFKKMILSQKHRLPNGNKVSADAEFSAAVSAPKSKGLYESLETLADKDTTAYDLSVYIAKLEVVKKSKAEAEAQKAA